MSVEVSIVNILVEALELEDETINQSTDLFSLDEWDSLGMLAVSAEIYDVFKIEISGDEFFAMETVADISNLVSTRSGRN